MSPPLGSGFFAHQSELCWRERRWGHVDSVRPDVGDGRVCKGFCSVPGPLQTVQRAEMWGVTFLLCNLLMLCIWG